MRCVRSRQAATPIPDVRCLSRRTVGDCAVRTFLSRNCRTQFNITRSVTITVSNSQPCRQCYVFSRIECSVQKPKLKLKLSFDTWSPLNPQWAGAFGSPRYPLWPAVAAPPRAGVSVTSIVHDRGSRQGSFFLFPVCDNFTSFKINHSLMCLLLTFLVIR